MTEDSRDQTTLGHDVFVSYASQDAAVANSIVENLELHGLKCWIAPRDVVPGTLYADGIVGAIDESRILVLILSKDAVASAHVGRELERAASKRHPIIALRTDTAPLTRAFEYFLNQSQWIEGGGSDAAIAQLVGAVGQHLAPGTATSPTNGIQRSAGHRKAAVPRRVWVIAAVVAVLLAGGYFLVDKAWRSKHETTASTAVISDKSIAVLPFTDMSEKKDQEYFGDGMAEEILDLLAKIPGLKVISRTSSFQFKGKSEDLRSIATQLGVAYVLEGSVRKSGDHLRVTAQLINSKDGTRLWSQTYDRDLSDVLKMQDEIAASLGRALDIEVSGPGLDSRPALRNKEAYTLYLQGLHAGDSLDPQGLEDALSDFQQALDLDPSFAAAAGEVASMYFLLGACEKARRAAEDAIKLDPKLGIAHGFLGEVYRGCDWNWAAADREVGLARSLSPNDVTVLFFSAVLSENIGRWDDALRFINASLVRDPLNPNAYAVLSLIQHGRGRLEEAEAAIRRTLAISPTHAFAHYWLGNVLLTRSQPDAALAEMLKEKVESYRLSGSAVAFFALRRKLESDAVLTQMIKSQADHDPFHIALVYAFRGESDEAFEWLDRAYAQKGGGNNLAYIKTYSAFRKIEGDPRYRAFLKKMNLPYE
jgi:TolB-like protein/Tfp pilus assembly protein PilF